MKILFCSLNAPGFLYPTVGIALCARDRGHEVAFAASSENADLLRRHGLRRIRRSEVSDGPSFDVKSWAKPLSVAMQVKHIERALDLFQPDVLFAQQLTLGPRICAELYGLPVALLGFCTYLWPVGDMSMASPQRRADLRWRHGDMVSLYNRARTLHGLEAVADDVDAGPLLGDVFFLQSVPGLEPFTAQLPPRVRLVGSCLWDDTHPSSSTALTDWIAAAKRDARPILYVEHGRVFDRPSFWPTLIEALRDSPFTVAASIGRADRIRKDPPAHWFVRDHVPQQVVLAHAAGVVTNGTTTVALGALTAGVPCLLIPTGGEQPDVAEVLGRAGVGHSVVPDQLSPGLVLEECLRLVSDEGLKSAACRLSREFAEYDGPEFATASLEQLRRPDQSLHRPQLRRSAAPAL